MKQKKNAGYTLIELIVVIAILAILVGVVVKVCVDMWRNPEQPPVRLTETNYTVR